MSQESRGIRPMSPYLFASFMTGMVRARGSLWLPLLTGSILFVTMPSWLYSGDPISMQAVTINLLTEGRIDVSAEQASRFGERGQYYVENPRNGRWYSKYGILNIVYYVPPLLAEWCLAGELKPIEHLNDAEHLRRSLLINLWNILVATVLVGYFYQLALLSGGSPPVAYQVVLLVVFGSFVWYYLRAQTVEIVQMGLFTAGMYHLMVFSVMHPWQQVQRAGQIQVLCAMLSLGALVLAKLIYIVLLPIALGLVVWLLVRPNMTGIGTNGSDDKRDATRTKLGAEEGQTGWRWCGASWKTLVIAASCVALTLVCVFLSNWLRFGSPWSTGYTQFARESVLFRMNWQGWWGYLVDPRKSIFLYAPLLPLGLLGSFWVPRAIRVVYLWGWLAFMVLYGINASFVNWRGDWCYGPRYLIFAIPALSIPLVSLLTPTSRFRRAQHVAMGLVLLGSLLSINSPSAIHGMGFFAAFEAEQAYELEAITDESVRAYFRQPHWRINSDLRAYCTGRRPFPWLPGSQLEMTEAQQERLNARLGKIPLQNYFWVTALFRGADVVK